MKKTIQQLILTTLIGGILIAPVPSKAVWGMGDINFDPSIFSQETIQTIGQVSQIVDMVQNALKTFGLDVIIYKVSQQMSQKLLTKVLNKANGGADGEGPKLFVENFGKYFQDITSQQLGEFTNSLNDSSNPFAQSISMGISDQFSGIGKSGLGSFSLDKLVPDGVSWQDAAKDISAAGDKGWDFYGSLAMPENSPLGSSMIAQDDLAKKIRSAQDTAKTELTSSGFKPDKEKAAGMFGGSGSSTDEAFPNVTFKSNITTPKTTQEKAAEQSVTESFDRLRNADTFGKIIFSTIQQMITGLIQKGFSKLGSDGGSSKQLYGGPKDLNSILSTNKSWSNAPLQTIDLQKELDIAIDKTDSEIKSIETTIDFVKKPLTDTSTFSNGQDDFTGTILSLEACVPGPDTGYELRLQDYVTKQVKDTQNRAGRDNDKGEKNSAALTMVRGEAAQAVLETNLLVSNSFLNLPGVTGMKSVLGNYYQTSKKFRGLVDTLIIKRQVVNSLKVLQSEAISAAQAVVNPNELTAAQCPPSLKYSSVDTGGATVQHCSLMLSDMQWSKLTAPQKASLYAALKPKFLSQFPEYLSDTTEQSQLVTATTTSSGSSTVILKNLKPDDLTTPDIDERDEDMKNRIMTQQWYEWESIVPSEKKTPLYGRFVGLSRDISDSASAQRAQLTAESTEKLYQELKDTLDDCKSIRTYLMNNNAAVANDDVFIATLKSATVKSSYKGPSILKAAEANVDFAKLNERVASNSSQGGSPLQLFTNAEPGTSAWQVEMKGKYSDIISGAHQNDRAAAFASLALYEFNYWKAQQQSSGGSVDPYQFNSSAFMNWYNSIIEPHYDNSILVNNWEPGYNPQAAVTAFQNTPPPLDTTGMEDVSLQVPMIPTNATAVIQQDNVGRLYCRLTRRLLTYWAPEGLTGEPIGCNGRGDAVQMHDYGAVGYGQKRPHANWYHTNNAEILFNVSAQ